MKELKRDPALTALVSAALSEDEISEDITSLALVPSDAWAEAWLVARAEGVLAGLFLLEDDSPLAMAFPKVKRSLHSKDGAPVHKDEKVARLVGPARDVLALERTLLNFLQRLSGIATATSRFAAACVGTRARIQETRKTCPGYRKLDKYAVRMGGGLNHRMSLKDQVLIKENHLVFAGAPRSPAAIIEGIQRARSVAPKGVLIEVEVEGLDQFEAALSVRPDIIMLDDFSNDQVKEAVEIRDRTCPPPPLIEVSGSVQLERVRSLAELGVDRISVGALTHSVKALDLALDVMPTSKRE